MTALNMLLELSLKFIISFIAVRRKLRLCYSCRLIQFICAVLYSLIIRNKIIHCALYNIISYIGIVNLPCPFIVSDYPLVKIVIYKYILEYHVDIPYIV